MNRIELVYAIHVAKTGVGVNDDLNTVDVHVADSTVVTVPDWMTEGCSPCPFAGASGAGVNPCTDFPPNRTRRLHERSRSCVFDSSSSRMTEMS